MFVISRGLVMKKFPTPSCTRTVPQTVPSDFQRYMGQTPSLAIK